MRAAVVDRPLHIVQPEKRCVYCCASADAARLIDDGPATYCCADTDACEARILDQQVGATSAAPTLEGPISLAGGSNFPIEAAIARYVVFGKSGAGKTNTDVVFAEEFIRNGVPTVILDVLGNMWGLRSSDDGQAPGLPIPILGGAFGDLPLEVEDAQRLAATLGEGRSAILDLSHLPRDDQHAFAATFVSELITRVTIPMHVIIEEAERLVPARSSSKGHFAASVAVSEFARQCRNETIGWTMSTQRVDHVSHDVLNANSVLVALQNSDEDEQRAILAQVASRVGKTKARKLFATFAGLKRGEAWFLPDAAWLGDDDAEAIPMRFRFRLRSTWDAAKPKKIGESRAVPAIRADVDIEPFRELGSHVWEASAPIPAPIPAPAVEPGEPPPDPTRDARRAITLELLRRFPQHRFTPKPLLFALVDRSEADFENALQRLKEEKVIETRRARGGGVALTEHSLKVLGIGSTWTEAGG
jgi:hypothetical protein